MATIRSVSRFINSQFSTTFSALKIGLTCSKNVQSLSRMSFQVRPRSNQYHAYSKYFQTTSVPFANHTWEYRTLPNIARRPLPAMQFMNGNFQRGITMVSKKGKRKTCKAVAKRFIRTGKGKLKRWRCGYHHNQSKKRGRRKRFLRKPTYASKTQLKTLNKMLNGW